MIQTFSRHQLDCIFGLDSTGDTFEEREKTSTRQWVRSQDHLGVYKLESGATGLILTPREVVELFGWEIVDEALEYGSAILPPVEDEPAASIRRCREKKGWTQEELATKADVPLSDLEKVENPKSGRVSIHLLIKLCNVLGIDGRVITFKQFGLDEET